MLEPVEVRTRGTAGSTVVKWEGRGGGPWEGSRGKTAVCEWRDGNHGFYSRQGVGEPGKSARKFVIGARSQPAEAMGTPGFSIFSADVGSDWTIFPSNLYPPVLFSHGALAWKSPLIGPLLSPRRTVVGRSGACRVLEIGQGKKSRFVLGLTEGLLGRCGRSEFRGVLLWWKCCGGGGGHRFSRGLLALPSQRRREPWESEKAAFPPRR